MAIEWVACEALTGAVITDLPDLEVESITHALMAYTTTQARLPIPAASPDWVRATEPMATYVVMLDDQRPIWGGLITQRVRTHGDVVELPLMSIEGYFRRRYVGDEAYTGVDQNTIVKDIVDKYVGDSLPITVEAAPSAITRDRPYEDDSDKSVFSTISELAAVINGPEWTVDWVRGDIAGQVTFRPVLRVADRLGSEPTNGLAPAVAFDMPGPVSAVTFTEDYTMDGGANVTLATSTAQGDVRPESVPQVFNDPQRLVAEYRFTPSTSITSISRLNSHALAALERLRNGTLSLSLELDATEAPKPNVDWFIGDRVGFNLFTPAFPDGLVGTARVTGWQRTFGDAPVLTPFLTDVEVEAV